MAGRILRRSGGGRWPNCAISPVSRPSIHGVTSVTRVDAIGLVSSTLLGIRQNILDSVREGDRDS